MLNKKKREFFYLTKSIALMILLSYIHPIFVITHNCTTWI